MKKIDHNGNFTFCYMVELLKKHNEAIESFTMTEIGILKDGISHCLNYLEAKLSQTYDFEIAKKISQEIDFYCDLQKIVLADCENAQP